MNHRTALLATLMGCDPQVEACAETLDRVEAYSVDMHRYDWAPFIDLTGTPSADLVYCERLAENRGVTIEHGREAATGAALLSTIILPAEYDDWPLRDRAAVLCHEMHHIEWQHRVGTFTALVVWADDVGRLTVEAAATAVSDDLFARYGESVKAAVKRRAIIAELFPVTYRVDIDSECVAEAMDWAQWEYWVWMSHGARLWPGARG